jgi:uncharacterized OB-fold protein
MRERPGPDATIPISLPGHLRNVAAKVGFSGQRCAKCGHLDYPPRFRCARCGAEEGGTWQRLPVTGSVYSVVTVRVPVPGLPSPYSIALVDLDGVALRVLAKVTGTAHGTLSIDDRGRLVLRRIATRSGIPDYAFCFEAGDKGPVAYEDQP